MRRLATVLLILTWIATATDAREGRPRDRASILASLGSDQPAEIAWGAYLAGLEGVDEAVPRLTELLQPHPDRESTEWKHLRLAALDALVLLQADLPVELLRHHRRGKSHARCLILMARSPKEYRQDLVSIFDRTSGRTMWAGNVAVGNLLLALRAPGFASSLLERLDVVLKLTVKDPEDSSIIGAGGGAFGGRGDSFVRLPENFPPYVHYYFYYRPVLGARLLADGPCPVYYVRREYKRGGLVTGIGAGGRELRKSCLEWLTALLGKKPGEFEVPKTTYKVIHWETPQTYLSEALAAREKALAPWRDAVILCMKTELLGREEAADLTVPFTLELKDRRGEKREPLPELLPYGLTLPPASRK